MMVKADRDESSPYAGEAATPTHCGMWMSAASNFNFSNVGRSGSRESSQGGRNQRSPHQAQSKGRILHQNSRTRSPGCSPCTRSQWTQNRKNLRRNPHPHRLSQTQGRSQRTQTLISLLITNFPLISLSILRTRGHLHYQAPKQLLTRNIPEDGWLRRVASFEYVNGIISLYLFRTLSLIQVFTLSVLTCTSSSS